MITLIISVALTPYPYLGPAPQACEQWRSFPKWERRARVNGSSLETNTWRPQTTGELNSFPLSLRNKDN